MNLSGKITRITDWTTSQGKDGQTVSLAAKGRILTFNPVDFEDLDTKLLKLDGAITIKNCEVDVGSYTTVDGQVRKSRKLLPKFGEVDLAVI